MHRFILSLLFIQTTYGATLTLKALLATATQPQLIEETLEQQRLSLLARSHADSSSEPLRLDSGVSYAETPMETGNEYTIGVSKALKLGNTQQWEQQQSWFASEADLLEASKKLIALHNEIRNLYHQHCLDRAYLEQLGHNVSNFEAIYRKKAKAYQYDEIAKTELLQLEMEKNRLQTKLTALQQQVATSQFQLLTLSQNGEERTLSCNDLYPITRQNSLPETFSLTDQSYQKRLQSTQAGMQRYAQSIDSLEVSARYSKELDRDVYAVGISVPLNFTSHKAEQERVALMHQSSALEREHAQIHQAQTLYARQLADTLNGLLTTIAAYEQNIDHYQNELLPMMKKSYDYAQSSVVEYLLNQQQLLTLHQELSEYKKSYYQTLFEFYTLSEMQ